MSNQQVVVAILVLVGNTIMAFPQDTGKLAGSSALTSLFGSGWSGGPITSTSSGLSGISTIQQGDAAQAIHLQSVGTGMTLNFNSSVISDGYSVLAQTGGNSGEGSADVNSASGATGIIPGSDLTFNIDNSDVVNLDVESVALGFEEVNTAVQQQASVTGDQGGLGWNTNPPSAGWKASVRGQGN